MTLKWDKEALKTEESTEIKCRFPPPETLVLKKETKEVHLKITVRRRH